MNNQADVGVDYQHERERYQQHSEEGPRPAPHPEGGMQVRLYGTLSLVIGVCEERIGSDWKQDSSSEEVLFNELQIKLTNGSQAPNEG